MKFTAYVVRFIPDGRVVYCGITTRGVAQRWKSHRKSKYAVGCAIKKYGVSLFAIEAVAESRSFEDLKECEILLIQQYDTYAPGGYNLTKGGDGVLGVRFSPELRAKWSRERKGRRFTEEQKESMRAAKVGQNPGFLGRKHSQESIAKIRAHHPHQWGPNNPFYGRHHSPETIKRISGSGNPMFRKKYTAQELERRSGVNNCRYGTRHTPETLAKMSAKQRGPNNPNFGKPWSAARRAKHMATLAAKGNASAVQ